MFSQCISMNKYLFQLMLMRDNHINADHPDCLHFYSGNHKNELCMHILAHVLIVQQVRLLSTIHDLCIIGYNYRYIINHERTYHFLSETHEVNRWFVFLMAVFIIHIRLVSNDSRQTCYCPIAGHNEENFVPDLAGKQ